MKLELKHLAPYLPYRLKCKTHKSIAILSDLTTNDIYECASFIEEPRDMIGENGMLHFEDFKPILRPLSDMNISDKAMDKLINGALSYNVFIDAVSQHFDVFCLIQQGLAIDINTLKQ